MRTKEIQDPDLKNTYLNGLFFRDVNHPMNQGYDAIEDFKGMRPERNCTQRGCVIVFAIFNLAFVALSVYTVKRVEFHKLLYGQDFRCDFCGIRQLSKEPLVYWPDPVNWGPNVKTCVPQCPTSKLQEVCLYNQTNTEYVSDYCQLAYVTKRIRNYCMPVEKPEFIKIVAQELRSWSNIFIRMATDVYLAKNFIALGSGVAICLALITSLFIMIDAGFVNKIWFYTMFTFGLGASAYLGVMVMSEETKFTELECSGLLSAECGIFRTIGYKGLMGMVWLSCLYMIYVVTVRFQRVTLNFKILPKLAQPIRICEVILIPLFFGIIISVVFFVFLFCFVLMMTTGFNELVDTGSGFYEPKVRRNSITSIGYYGSMFVIITLYFHVSFLVSVQRSLIGVMISQWYFSKTKLWLSKTAWKGIKVVYKHLGTMLYHSYVVALIRPVRLLFGFFKRYFDKIETASKLQMFTIRCCKFCVRWHELKLKYLTSDVVYQTTIFGDNFQAGGIKLFYFKFRNQSRLKPFEGKFGIFSNFQTIFVSSISALVTYFLLQQSIDSAKIGTDFDKMEMPVIIPLIVYIITIYSCRGYTYMMDYSYEMMIYCFVADEEMFQGSQIFADPEMRDFFNIYGSQSEKDYIKNVENQDNLRAAAGKKKKRRQRKQKRQFDEEAQILSDNSDLDSENENPEDGEGLEMDFMAILNKKKKEREEVEKYAKEDTLKKDGDDDELESFRKKRDKIEIPKNSKAYALLKATQRQQAVREPKRNLV